MSIGQTSEIKSSSSEETEALGRKIGESLRGGEVIELIGDVGAGKTTFVRGLAQGLGSRDTVSSPTYTVSNAYQGKFPLYHFDFYRVRDDQLIRNELADVIEQHLEVIVLEWADTVRSLLPRDHITINFVTSSENERVINVDIPRQLSYIQV